MQKPLLVLLHGVNLDLLGERPVEHYGTVTLAELEERVRQEAATHSMSCECHQTNHEGRFVELIHRFRQADAMILNPGAWTHYSYAIHDAAELVTGPLAEVHLSDPSQRESWRQQSVLEDIAAVKIAGRGPEGYTHAVRELARRLSPGTPERTTGEERTQ